MYLISLHILNGKPKITWLPDKHRVKCSIFLVIYLKNHLTRLSYPFLRDFTSLLFSLRSYPIFLVLWSCSSSSSPPRHIRNHNDISPKSSRLQFLLFYFKYLSLSSHFLFQFFNLLTTNQALVDVGLLCNINFLSIASWISMHVPREKKWQGSRGPLDKVALYPSALLGAHLTSWAHGRSRCIMHATTKS